MSPEKRSLNGFIEPSTFYSATPLPSKSFTPHRPSLLRHASGPDTVSPPPRPTIQVVINSSPLKTLVVDAFEAPSTQPKKRGRPFSQKTPIPKIAKKKGRPFKTPEAAAAALAKARANSDDTLKKRGRPFKIPNAPEHLAPVEPPEPKWVPFICEVVGCPAELHNISTLRAHLHTVHLKRQPREGPFMCRWKKCCQDIVVLDEGTGVEVIAEKGVEFVTKEEWKDHVEKAHIDPVAWYQGDGPKAEIDFFTANQQQPDTSLDYLNYNGRQVTPLLDKQPIQEGRAKDNNMARFKKERDGLYVVLVPRDDLSLYMKDDLEDDP